MNQTEEKYGTFSALGNTISQYVKLLVEDTRLSLAEKLTRLFSAIALSALLTILCSVAMVFVSIAIALGLSELMNPLWAFVIVAAFYLVVLVLLITCRNALIVNPIARFISRLLLPAPKKESTNDQSASIPQ